MQSYGVTMTCGSGHQSPLWSGRGRYLLSSTLNTFERLARTAGV